MSSAYAASSSWATSLRPAVAAAVCASASAWCLTTSGPEEGTWLSKAIGHLLPLSLGDSNIPKQPSTTAAAGPSQEALDRLKDWLVQQGADIRAIDFKPSQVGPEAGVGVFVNDSQKSALVSRRRRWWAPWTRRPDYAVVAEFPLSNAITAANILNSQQAGDNYGWLVSRGALDERVVVQAYLAVERARGHTSSLAPWMDALPHKFHSPIMWSAAELAELRGTTLGRATQALHSQLADKWRSPLQEVLTAICKSQGAPRAPTFEDLLWAHCVFWSRGQSLPVPLQQGPASQIVAHAASKSQLWLIDVHEGIVPGLDFVNHRSPNPGCWWEVVQSQAHAQPPRPAPAEKAKHAFETGDYESFGTSDSSQHRSASTPLSTASVRLQLHAGWAARAGHELTINYGDGKSNEELLLLYGFVREGGSAEDMVMVEYPIKPSSQWDEEMNARVMLLTSTGMRPQCFLKASNVQQSAATAAAASDSAPVPIEALETLEVFVLDPTEVTARLEALESQRQDRLKGDAQPGLPTLLSGAELDLDQTAAQLKRWTSDKVKGGDAAQQMQQLATQLGLRMATLTTFVRLLEVQLVELEGTEHGTGSLEHDLALLDQHKAAVAAAASGKQVEGLLAYRKWCAVVYRAGQKRVVRAHLVGARQELQRVMGLLTQVQDLERQHENVARG